MDGETIAESATAEGEGAVAKGDAMKKGGSDAASKEDNNPEDAYKGESKSESKEAQESEKDQSLF